jgi:NAD(P)-dependent dehydrogenase (short-subunit alcohol dehydrogenase family)
MAAKNAVVIGATGVVGQGAVYHFLQAGFRVAAVSRSADKLKALRESLAKVGANVANLHDVVAHFEDSKGAENGKAAIKAAFKGAAPDHVVTVQGFVETTQGGPSKSSVDDLKRAFDSGLYPNLRAAQVLLGEQRARDGTSFTLVSGGFSHVCVAEQMWLGTVKNAALNALQLALAKETEGDKVRVNDVCIHFGVAAIGGDKNQLGYPGIDTRKLGALFLAIANGKAKGRLLCLSTGDDVDKLVASVAAP